MVFCCIFIAWFIFSTLYLIQSHAFPYLSFPSLELLFFPVHFLPLLLLSLLSAPFPSHCFTSPFPPVVSLPFLAIPFPPFPSRRVPSLPSRTRQHWWMSPVKPSSATPSSQPSVSVTCHLITCPPTPTWRATGETDCGTSLFMPWRDKAVRDWALHSLGQ